MPLSHHRCLRITHRYPIRTFFPCVINRGFEGETFPVFEEGVALSILICITEYMSQPFLSCQWLSCHSFLYSGFYFLSCLCPITLHLNHMKRLPTVWTFFHVATEETKGVWWEGVRSGKQNILLFFQFIITPLTTGNRPLLIKQYVVVFT